MIHDKELSTPDIRVEFDHDADGWLCQLFSDALMDTLGFDYTGWQGPHETKQEAYEHTMDAFGLAR